MANVGVPLVDPNSNFICGPNEQSMGRCDLDYGSTGQGAQGAGKNTPFVVEAPFDVTAGNTNAGVNRW